MLAALGSARGKAVEKTWKTKVLLIAHSHKETTIDRESALAGNAATTTTAHSELGHATQYGDSTNKRTHTGTKANNRETRGERRSRVRVKRNGLNGVDETTLRCAPTPRRTADHTAHLARSLALEHGRDMTTRRVVRTPRSTSSSSTKSSKSNNNNSSSGIAPILK